MGIHGIAPGFCSPAHGLSLPPQPRRPLLYGLQNVSFAQPLVSLTPLRRREKRRIRGRKKGGPRLRQRIAARAPGPSQGCGSSQKPSVGYHLYTCPGAEGAALLKLSPLCGSRTRGSTSASSLGVEWGADRCSATVGQLQYPGLPSPWSELRKGGGVGHLSAGVKPRGLLHLQGKETQLQLV